MKIPESPAYIAGPMSGVPLYNFPEFDMARDFLLGDLGVEKVYSPADLDRDEGFDPVAHLGQEPDEELLESVIDRDLGSLRASKSIVLLPGWQHSTGARAERAVAEWMGIPVYELESLMSSYQDKEDIVMMDGTCWTCVDDDEAEPLIEDDGKTWTETAEEMECDGRDDGWSGTVRRNPKDLRGMKKVSLSVFPQEVLGIVGLAMMEGAAKYGPYNWREEKIHANEYFNANWRHMGAWWCKEDLDPDSGIHHVAKAIASNVVLLDAILHGVWVDNRQPASNPGWLAGLNAGAAKVVEAS